MTTWLTAMVTGHRPQHLPPTSHDWVRSELARLAVKLRDEHNTTTGVSGLALGADTWWALAVEGARLNLWAHIPFPQQPDKWRAADRTVWEGLCRRAWKLQSYGGYYDVRYLHERNSGMLSVSQVVIAVHLPSKVTGGTASCVEKATKLGLPIIHVNPERLTTTLRPPAAA